MSSRTSVCRAPARLPAERNRQEAQAAARALAPQIPREAPAVGVAAAALRRIPALQTRKWELSDTKDCNGPEAREKGASASLLITKDNRARTSSERGDLLNSKAEIRIDARRPVFSDFGNSALGFRQRPEQQIPEVLREA